MLNQLVLMGRATRDPELRKLNDGKSVCTLTIASDDTTKKDNKETLFLACNFYGQTADALCKYVKKGDLIAVSGRLRQRKYTNRDNVEVTVFECNVDKLELMPKGLKQNAQETANAPAPQATAMPTPPASSAPSDADLLGDFGDGEGDTDLPF